MIHPGENPEGMGDRINKFLVDVGRGVREGHRGEVVAIRDNGREAILRGLTIHDGELILVREYDAGEWPMFVRRWSTELPAHGWTFYDRDALPGAVGRALRRVRSFLFGAPVTGRA